MMMIKKYLKFLLITFFLFACGNDKQVLVIVDDNEITTNEFKLNYEFGLPINKIGNSLTERKQNYLESMINERLVSLEAIKLGFDNSEFVKRNLEKFRTDLAIESLINDVIEKRIVITDKEIKEAINKSSVSFKFKFYVSDLEENAIKFKEIANNSGFDIAYQNFQKNNELSLPSSNQTEYLSWLDLNESLLNGIKNLEINEVSDVIMAEGKYFIVELIDIRRTSVIENDYISKYSSYKKILFGRKITEESVRFVDSLLTPMNIRVKQKVFNILLELVSEWISIDENNIFSEFLEGASKKVIINSEPFFIAKNKEVYYKELADFINFNSVKAGFQKNGNLRGNLYEEVGKAVRNYFLLKESEKLNLTSNDNFIKELNLWKLKLSFDYYKSELYKNIGSKEIKNELLTIADSLRKNNRISLKKEILDTLQINETEKSKHQSVLLLKGGTNRLAVPFLDPIWGKSNEN